MKKKRFRIILLAVLAVVFISGCKQNVGTPEDNAVVEEQEEEPEDETEEGLFGYSCPDLENPFYQVLKDSIGTELEEYRSALLVRNAQQDADVQAAYQFLSCQNHCMKASHLKLHQLQIF